MNVRSVLQRHRALRWAVPAGVAAVATVVATGALESGPAPSRGLPAMSPAALLADVRQRPATGFSGTVLTRASLGLPDLPALGGSAAGQDAGDSVSISSLLSGSHTVQVWYGGPDEQRVAVLGALDETDFFHSGRQVWTWNSADRVAGHAVLPARPAPRAAAGASATASLTPQALADQALAALSPSTQVTVAAGPQVADRNAYELVLTPRTAQTRVASVHISVDAATKLPLAVRVYARGASDPAIDVAYTSVRFVTPPSTAFAFTPPAGATVHTVTLPRHDASGHGRRTHVHGSGWTRVVEVDPAKPVRLTGQLAHAFTPVSGPWGRGSVLESALVSVLVTSTGRVFAGAVDPSALYAAAAAPAGK